jgi:hypothetical protein
MESAYIFTAVGMEPWGRIGSGVVELIASILLVVPRTVVYGALISLVVISGAIFFHLTKLGVALRDLIAGADFAFNDGREIELRAAAARSFGQSVRFNDSTTFRESTSGWATRAHPESCRPRPCGSRQSMVRQLTDFWELGTK